MNDRKSDNEKAIAAMLVTQIDIIRACENSKYI